MKIENQCVSLELAKRLNELGIKQESFFHWSYQWKNHPTLKRKTQSNNLKKLSISAFTVAELGEMLPYYSYETIKSINWVEFRCDHFHMSFRHDNEANARALMIIWLIENGFIKNE